jgi:hypothetical protein
MASGIGIALALALLLGLLAALWWSWRHPFVGLGLIVAGMAFHSFVLMTLLQLGTPPLLVRAFQGWKELLLAVLAIAALAGLARRRRELRSADLLATDWIAIAFAALAVVYFLLPGSVLHSGANLAQRAIGFRIVALIPLLYFLGRRFQGDDRERSTVAWLCVGAAALVAVFGLVELWLVPTRTWLSWGVNAYTAYLGFRYHGPGGLPENFFLTLGDGTLVRRMVSTYISPLGIAYTGLLVMPLGVVLVDRPWVKPAMRWLAALTLGLLLIGVMFSLTRLALLATVGEAGLLFLLMRRSWVAALVPILIGATALMLYVYPSVGPTVDRNLNPGGGSHGQAAVSGNDSSSQEHFGYLVNDLKVDIQHPLGLGTGASTVRYGQLVGTGESAVLSMFGDLGLAGGLLYLALYVLSLWNGFRAFRAAPKGSLTAALPLVTLVGGLALIPITVTSDVWGDLSVTFLFWWAAGASATVAQLRTTGTVTASPAGPQSAGSSHLVA